MRITWSLPVPGEPVESGRGDIVRAHRLSQAIRDLGHDVQLVAGSEQAEAASMVSVYRQTVRTFLPSALASPLRDLGRLTFARMHARRVAEAVERQGAQVLVETQVHLIPSGLLAAERTGIPLVLDDCSPPAEERVLGAGLPGALVSRLFDSQARAARAMVVSSQALVRSLERWGEGRLRVVPNGVAATASMPSAPGPGRPKTRIQVRREHGLGEGPVIVFVGSFQPWHRVDLLVDAVAGIADGPCPQLLLVGDGPSRAGVLDRVRELGLADRVHAPGRVPPDSLPRLLAAADLGVVPGTNSWGQPMKLVEYAAAGLPAVAPDLPPVREVVVPGRTGLLFPQGDLAGLQSSLEKLLLDPVLRACMAEAGQEAAREWSWRERALALLPVLEEVAEGAGSPASSASPSQRRSA